MCRMADPIVTQLSLTITTRTGRGRDIRSATAVFIAPDALALGRLFQTIHAVIFIG